MANSDGTGDALDAETTAVPSEPVLGDPVFDAAQKEADYAELESLVERQKAKVERAEAHLADAQQGLAAAEEQLAAASAAKEG